MKQVFFLLLLLLCFGTEAQQCTLILTGHIEDPDTRKKLSGATVLLVEQQKQITTDSKGNFSFTGLCAGNYTLKVSHVDCEPIEQKIMLVKDQHLDIDMPHHSNTMDEVMVSAIKSTQNTGSKKTLSADDLDKTRGQSLAETLSRLNGVAMLQAGATVAKPMIHGLHGNRILTINNGVRQEGQQWGNDHAPEIDPMIAGKMEVINGVDELKYGSDAIGAVIVVDPKKLRTQPGYQAQLLSGFYSNNLLWYTSGMIDVQPKKWHEFAFRLQGTLKRGANVATAHYRLNNTASAEKNFSIALGWKKHALSTEAYYSFFDTRLGIFEGAHIGNTTDLLHAIEQPRPNPVFTGEQSYTIGRPYQAARHQLLKLKTEMVKGKNKWSLQASSQYNNREEYDIVRSSNHNKPQMNLAILSLSQNISWLHQSNPGLSHEWALHSMQQINKYAGRYFIPAYHAYHWGGYYISKYQIKKWNLQAGIRYDNKTIYTKRILSNGEAFDKYGFNFSTLGASVNLGHRFTQYLKANINLGISGRAPQTNELLSNGIHHGTATYETGNIHLKPERSTYLNATAQWQLPNKMLEAELTLYAKKIDRFIYLQPLPNEPVLTIAGAYPQLQYRQNNVQMQGFDFSVQWKISEKLSNLFAYSMLRAKNVDSNYWLIQMPADRISSSLAYQINPGKKANPTHIALGYQYVFKQSRTPHSNAYLHDYKAAPNGYALVTLEASTTVRISKLPLKINAGIKNLFNTVYRDYLNTMRYFTDETGRNIHFNISIPITSKP